MNRRALQRRFRNETLEAEARFKTSQRDLCEEVVASFQDVEKRFESEKEALRKQLDAFKDVLKEGGLIDA